MPENGSVLLTDEDRREYMDKLEAVAGEEAAGAGFAIQGMNPYDRDWQVNFDWPERAGVQVGDDWIEDSVQAEVAHATYVVGEVDSKTRRVREGTLRYQSMNNDDVREMRESVGWKGLREYGGNPDPFAYGADQTLGAMGQYIPLWPGPVTRQLYWQDYWQMSAKAFEAYNHDPVSWRCVHMKQEYALGRGLELKVTYSRGSKVGQKHEKAAEVHQEYWERNKMDQRLDTMARDYCWAGEQFLRYFKKGPKLTIRSIDPASIYDLITDPEDIETVFAYHQQFQTAYQLYPPDKANPSGVAPAPTGPSTPGSSVKYIIRQILPQEIDHYKTNASAFERRGRSDLFPALGWIKRLRDYLTAHVVQADMISRICWDLKVAGNQSAINSLKSILFPNGAAPQPGTVFAHNTASTLEMISPPTTHTGSRGDPILDALVTMVADSIGLPKDWLGFGMQNTRAGALVATEPASKSLVELQGSIEGWIHDGFDRVMDTAGITDAQLEVTFPSIAQEDRKEKLDDLGTMEANCWISKRTAGTLAAREMDITTYDYDTEQKLISEEFSKPETQDHPDGLLGADGKPVQVPSQGDGKIRRQALVATKRQAPKLDLTKSPAMEDDPPGLLVPTDGSNMPAPGSLDGTGRTVMGGGGHEGPPTRGGTPGTENPISAAGARDIKSEHTNIREGEDAFVLTPDQLAWLLMRERHGARRRPDDPDFLAQAEGFRKEASENLKQLVADAGGRGVTGQAGHE